MENVPAYRVRLHGSTGCFCTFAGLLTAQTHAFMKILVLFTELAEYVLACLNELAEVSGAEVHVIRYPVNREAPFQFTGLHPRVVLHDRSLFAENELVDVAYKLSPQLVMVSGWKDKGYLKVAKAFHGKVPTVLLFDNKWKGGLKQNLASLISPFHLRKRFSHCFVPGPEQAVFARKLGYPPNRILQGFYCCDTGHFARIFHDTLPAKRATFPRRLLYVGRYYDFKGITDLWEAFSRLHSFHAEGWELWCLGTGDLPPAVHPSIKHFGFVQPRDMPPFLAQCGVFVMPSRIEPWGVVLHEMACAGFPLLASREVGSAVTFLQAGENGYVFDAGNADALERALVQMMEKTDAELTAMGESSHRLGLTLTTTLWSKKLLGILTT